MTQLICLVFLFLFSTINSFASTSSNKYNTDPQHEPILVARLGDFINQIQKYGIKVSVSPTKNVLGEPEQRTPKKNIVPSPTINPNDTIYLFQNLHKKKIKILYL